MTDSIVFNALLIFFAVAPVFDGIVTLLLFTAWWSKPIPALRERLVSSIAIFMSTLLISFLSINRLFDLHVQNDLGVAMLLLSLVLVSIPSINWLYMYTFRKF